MDSQGNTAGGLFSSRRHAESPAGAGAGNDKCRKSMVSNFLCQPRFEEFSSRPGESFARRVSVG